MEKLDQFTKSVVYILEVLLQNRDDVFPISKIPNFWRMVVKMSEYKNLEKLGQFSKVMAFLILDRSNKSFSKMFEEKYPLRYCSSVKLIDINE